MNIDRLIEIFEDVFELKYEGEPFVTRMPSGIIITKYCFYDEKERFSSSDILRIRVTSHFGIRSVQLSIVLHNNKLVSANEVLLLNYDDYESFMSNDDGWVERELKELRMELKLSNGRWAHEYRKNRETI